MTPYKLQILLLLFWFKLFRSADKIDEDDATGVQLKYGFPIGRHEGLWDQPPPPLPIGPQLKCLLPIGRFYPWGNKEMSSFLADQWRSRV